MDKQKLRKMPTQPAPSWMTKEAATAKLKKNDLELWYADVQQEDDITVLRVYERSKLIGGIADKENYRIYLDAANREYVSQQMDLKPPKCWRTGRINSVLGKSDIWSIPYFEGEPGYVSKGYTPYLSIDKAGADALEKALGPLEEKETWGLRIYKWQDNILQERLERRHEKELEPTVERMSHIPDLPEGFEEWITTEGIARFDYVLYSPLKGKKTTDIQCTRCGAKMQIDVKKIKPVRDKRGICPACGRPITWKTATSKLNRSMSYFYKWDEPWYTAIIQRMEDGLVVRYFAVDIRFDMEYGTCKGREITYSEVARDFFPDVHSTEKLCYEWVCYKGKGNPRWSPANLCWEYHTEKAFLYTANLKEVLAGTAWQYSGLKDYQEKKWPEKIYLSAYMRDYPKKPYMEYFCKMGLIRLTEDLISWWCDDRNLIDAHGKNPEQVLKINTTHIKTLLKYNGGRKMLSLLQHMEKYHVEMSVEETVHYEKLFGDEREHLLHDVHAGNLRIDVRRLLKYIQKQAVKSFDKSKWDRRFTKAEALLLRERGLWGDWVDYMVWLERYMPDCATDPYYVLPPDLPKAHDRLMEMETAQRKKSEAERRRKQEEAVNRFLSEMQETGGIGMQARGLLIRLPRDVEEIRQEGKLQHHCVATYIDRVERHETIILFVRKVDDPEKPFYTLEWKNGKVAQCRGMRNADMTPEVKAFVTAFEKAMQKKSREAERQKVQVTA